VNGCTPAQHLRAVSAERTHAKLKSWRSPAAVAARRTRSARRDPWSGVGRGQREVHSGDLC
jgi:hypothetical protein